MTRAEVSLVRELLHVVLFLQTDYLQVRMVQMCQDIAAGMAFVAEQGGSQACDETR